MKTDPIKDFFFSLFEHEKEKNIMERLIDNMDTEDIVESLIDYNEPTKDLND